MTRILVIRSGALGDFILTLPVFSLLRQQWPEAQIECLGRPRFAPLAVGRYLNDMRSVDSAGLVRFFVPDAELDPTWSAYFQSFDLIISYLYDPDGLFKANLLRCQPGRVLVGHPHLRTGPAAAALAEPLRELGLTTEDWRSRVWLNPDDNVGASPPVHSSYYSFHPGSGSLAKNWPITRWHLLARKVMDPVVVFLGEAEGEDYEKGWPTNVTIQRETSLKNLAVLLSRSRLHVGHDSGVTHLAAAVGAPTLALFGPTEEKIWAPPGAHVRVVRGGDFMGDLEVATVHQAVLNPPLRAVD